MEKGRVNWTEYLKTSPTGLGGESIMLDDLKEFSKIECLIPNELWVASVLKGDWLEFCFLEFMSYHSEKEKYEVDIIMHGCGPINGLNECRHTYWGKEGYMFYPNKKYIETALNWLKKYYDV